MPLHADKMKTPFRMDFFHSGRQSSIRIRSRKTVSESQPRSSTCPIAFESEKETIRLHGHGLRSSFIVQAEQAARIAAKKAGRRTLSIIDSGVFMDHIILPPVVNGGVEEDVNRTWFVFFGISGPQISDNGLFDNIGFVSLHRRQSN